MLSNRGKVITVFVVAFFSTFFMIYAINGLANSLPFDSLNAAVNKALFPGPTLAFCAFVVCILVLLRFKSWDVGGTRSGNYGGGDGDGDWGGDGGSWGGGGGGSSGFGGDD